MPNTTEDTHPLTALRDNPTQILDQLKTTRRPITLTVDGKPEAILQDPTEYQGLRNLADLAEENEAIRLGIEDMHAGRTRPLDEVFDEMREKYAIPR
jgi:PHD/YefM family antitoxin component YafN of YafNO toxin-antitoxin module